MNKKNLQIKQDREKENMRLGLPAGVDLNGLHAVEKLWLEIADFTEKYSTKDEYPIDTIKRIFAVKVA